MKLLEAIKSAKRIEFDLCIGKDSTTVKVTKKDALKACRKYLETVSVFGIEWRDQNNEIIARLFDETLSIGN